MEKKFVFEYLVPIEEFKEVSEERAELGVTKEFIIEGTAINATTTRNGHKFTAQELQSSASTLTNKPLLKDHNNSVDAIIGRVKSSPYDMQNSRVRFQARVVDPKYQQMIKDKLITNVSVGAMVRGWDEEKNEAGEVQAVVLKGIEFVELSLVAVPADPNAGFESSVHAAFTKANTVAGVFSSTKTPSGYVGGVITSSGGTVQSIPAISNKPVSAESLKCPECGKEMDSKEDLKAHMADKHDMSAKNNSQTSGNEVQSKTEEPMSETKTIEDLRKANEALEAEVLTLKNQRLQEAKEALMKAPVKAEEQAPAPTVGKVAKATENKSPAGKYILENSELGGYAFSANYNSEGVPLTLRRK